MLYIKLNKNEMGYHNLDILNEKSQFLDIAFDVTMQYIYIYIYIYIYKGYGGCPGSPVFLSSNSS